MPARSLQILALLTLIAAVGGCSVNPWAGVTSTELATLNVHRIRGIALLENNQPGPAAVEFQAIQKKRPGLAFGYLNEAACYVLDPDKAAAALKPAQLAIDREPKQAWGYLLKAALLGSLGRYPEQAGALEVALKLEPNNSRVIGAMVRFLRDQPGGANARLTALRARLVERAPNNLAARLELLQSQVDQRQTAEAEATLEKVRQLLPRLSVDERDFLARARKDLAEGRDATSDARSLVNVLRGGAAYQLAQNEVFGAQADPALMVQREWWPAPPPLPAPPLAPIHITWKDVTQAAGLDQVRAPGVSPISPGDVDLGWKPGLTLPAGEAPVQAVPDLAIGDLSGGPLLGTGQVFGKSSQPGVGSPLLVDLNNDFALECYVATPGGDVVWRNPLRGKNGERGLVFSRATGPPPPVKVAARGPGSATAVDLDQDGDLDILRASSDPHEPAVRYLRNNGNFTFSDLTDRSGLRLPSEGARQVVSADFDNDLDPDVFVVRSDGGCRLFLNGRQDVFADRSAAWGVKTGAGTVCAGVADYDRDGNWDLAVVGKEPNGSVLYHNNGSRFTASPLPLPAGLGPEWLEWLDYDNDGWLDLVIAGKGGLLLLHNDQGKLAPAETIFRDPCRWVTALDYDRDGDNDLLAVTADDHIRLLRNDGGSGRPSLRMELQGYQVAVPDTIPYQLTHANSSYGIGAGLLVRTPWDEQRVLVTRPETLIGLGRAAQATTVRVDWTNGAPEAYLAPSNTPAIHMAQHVVNSCPFLYAWDGERWRFIKDFNWRSPLGMLKARGVPVSHDLTSDWDKVSGDELQSAGGYLKLIATEELHELAYFDQLGLLAVDHPEGTGVYVDERFPFGPADPFRIYTTREEKTPVSARDGVGNDLLPALKAEDNVFTPAPPGPLRGICAPHDLILDLGAVPDPGNVKLFLSGWLFPQPNSSNINASQNPEVRMIPPALSFGDGRGGWTHADSSVGLPCGKRKTIVVDLSGRFTRGDYRVKLTTTCEIRWDRAFFTSGEAPVDVAAREVPLAEADLSEQGISERYYDVPEGPDMHRYERKLEGLRAPEWPPISGAYTRLGDCAPLLKTVDDRYAIIGPGDALRLTFDGRKLPALKPGWRRDYVVRCDGWTKDADSNTLLGDTVEPLPFHGMKTYPYGPEEGFPDTPEHRRWKREWNTRIKGRSGRQAFGGTSNRGQ